jgi:hypothetical protein
MLLGSVGRQGANRRDDTLIVQLMLNDFLGRTGKTLLKLDGIVGPLTIGAIETAQRSFGFFADGRVDVNGPTIKNLVASQLESARQAMSKTTYGLQMLEVAKKMGRTPDVGGDDLIEPSKISADVTNVYSHMISLMRAHLK